LQTGEYGFSNKEFEIIENQVQYLREMNRLKLFPKLKQFFSEQPEVFNLKLREIFKVTVS
jgi:hypothetical protein